MYDLVALGEAMIRLAAPHGESLESAHILEMRSAGSEANVTVALARMGFRTSWISKLVDDPLGRRIAGDLRRHGVDTSAVVWATGGRTGLYFLEQAPSPRGVTVYYDRSGSAFSTLRPEEIDLTSIGQARWAHTTGITPALGDPCARSAERFLSEARAAGVATSLDVNHRRKLWSANKARDVLMPLLDGINLVIATQEDAREVFDLHGAPRELAVQLRERVRAGAAVVTAGVEGAHLADGEGVHSEAAIPGAEVDPIGRGDAFAAGLIWGALEGDLAAGLRYGAALASLSQTFWGDVPWTTRQEVLGLLTRRTDRPVR